MIKPYLYITDDLIIEKLSYVYSSEQVESSFKASLDRDYSNIVIIKGIDRKTSEVLEKVDYDAFEALLAMYRSMLCQDRQLYSIGGYLYSIEDIKDLEFDYLSINNLSTKRG